MSAPLPTDDGWIEWTGGECPIDLGVVHQRRYRDGTIGVYRQVSRIRPSVWAHRGDENDVIAYRVLP